MSKYRYGYDTNVGLLIYHSTSKSSCLISWIC